MKRSYLAVAAVLGAAVLPAEAAQIKVDDNTFANMGLKLQIWAQKLDKTSPTGQSFTDFSIQNARIYFSGQVNKLVQFGANLDLGVYSGNAGRANHQGTAFSRANDAFINFKAMDELQLMAGLYRLPFSRASLTDSYTYYIPTGYSYIGGNRSGTGYTTPGNYYTPFTIGSNIKNSYRDAGVTLWGNVADGMLQYRLGVFDGRWDHVNALGVKDNLAYSLRVQFSPTMLGYKGEKSYGLRDTYLGRQNVLTIGFGYNTQKWDDNAGKSGTAKAWVVDAMWEQKFGDIVPNLQLGYQDMKDLPNTPPPPPPPPAGAFKTKFRTYYVQGHLLFDQVVGLGKPGLGLRYEKLDDKNAGNKDATRLGMFLNYYIKGQDAKVQFGFDNVSLSNKAANERNYTDWTLALQTQF